MPTQEGKNEQRSDLLQGTLDLLILRTLLPGEMHGWGIAQRIQQTSAEVLSVTQGSLYPALYRLESTGLLSTEGNLRTRTIPSYRRGSEGGVGRNFLVQEYLREGDYQITVKANGQSTGHLGVSLSRTRLHDGGTLSPGDPALEEKLAERIRSELGV